MPRLKEIEFVFVRVKNYDVGRIFRKITLYVIHADEWYYQGEKKKTIKCACIAENVVIVECEILWHDYML